MHTPKTVEMTFCALPFANSSNIAIFYRLTLEVMTLNPTCESVETAEGVAVTVTGVAQVKVMKGEFLGTACEQFLGKRTSEIENVILQTLEGHLRAILGTLTVEEIYKGTCLVVC